MLGGYIGRIFNEVKARPLYIVRRTYGLDETPAVVLDAASTDKAAR